MQCGVELSLNEIVTSAAWSSVVYKQLQWLSSCFLYSCAPVLRQGCSAADAGNVITDNAQFGYYGDVPLTPY